MSRLENKRTALGSSQSGSEVEKPSSFNSETYSERNASASEASIDPVSWERIERLTDQVDLELDADRRFFERRPSRSYRVRRSYPVECEVFTLQAAAVLPVGYALFVAVYQIQPGTRLRFPFTAPGNIETDLSEHDAKAAFAFVTGRTDGPAVLASMRGMS